MEGPWTSSLIRVTSWAVPRPILDGSLDALENVETNELDWNTNRATSFVACAFDQMHRWPNQCPPPFLANCRVPPWATVVRHCAAESTILCSDGEV